jgi:hypothetical protein
VLHLLFLQWYGDVDPSTTCLYEYLLWNFHGRIGPSVFCHWRLQCPETIQSKLSGAASIHDRREESNVMKCPKWLSKIFASNDALLPFTIAIVQFGMGAGHFTRTHISPLQNIVFGTMFLIFSLMMFTLGIFTVAKRFRPRQVGDFRKF